jgi:uroporphyrinogen-III decarboxylase
MVEGAGSDNWRTLKTMLHTRPDLLHRILEVNARAVADYLNAQIDAGADAVMLFDTWGGMLAYEDYEAFSLRYSREIFRKVTKVPTILFTKGGNPWLGAMMQSGCAAVGLDWNATRARRADWPQAASRCREISIPSLYSRRRSVCAKPRARCLKASVLRRGTSSISATEYFRKHLWNQWPRS